MLPFQQALPGPDSDDGPAPSTKVGSSETATQKTFIRVLDERSVAPDVSPDDHDDYLQEIHYGIGAAQGDELVRIPSTLNPGEILDVAREPEHQRANRHASWLHSTSPNLQHEDPLSLSELSNTDGGRSFSVLNDTFSSLDMSLQSAPSVCLQSPAIGPIFSYRPIFEWENQQLVFDGEPLTQLGWTHSWTQCSSNLRVFTAASSLPVLSSKSLAEVQNSSSSSNAGSSWIDELSIDSRVESALVPAIDHSPRMTPRISLIARAFASRQYLLPWKEPRDVLVDIVVEFLVKDYFRSYAPQRSQKRGASAQDRSRYLTNPNNGASAASNTVWTKPKGRSTKRGTTEGSEESEDGDSEDDGGVSIEDLAGTSPRPFACPFYRWNPQKYRECEKYRLYLKVTQVKAHILKKHVGPNSITAEGAEDIKKYADRCKDPEQQWQGLYELLFPGGPPPLSPYLHSTAQERVMEAEHYYRNSAEPRNLRKELEDLGCIGPGADQIWNLVYLKWLPKVLISLTSGSYVNGPGNERIALGQDGEHAAGSTETQQRVQLDRPGTVMSKASDEIELPIYPCMGLTQSPLMANTWNGQTNFGNGANGGHLSRGDVVDLEMTPPENRAWTIGDSDLVGMEPVGLGPPFSLQDEEHMLDPLLRC